MCLGVIVCWEWVVVNVLKLLIPNLCGIFVFFFFFFFFFFLYNELCNNLVQPLIANVGPLAQSAERGACLRQFS